MKLNGSWHCLLIGLLALMIAMPAQVFAQDPAPVFRQEELDQILAPIALYPDPLLAQILMAATYPLEIVLADRWVKENSYLEEDALNDALDLQNWDPSVKALVTFPNILSMMSEEIDWTQNVGEAFLAQETTVMDTIQQLRDKAYAAGNLTSNQKLLVSREADIITIEPYNPQVIYVPVYDPWEVYGSWWWPHYPPYVVYRYPYDVVIAPGVIWFGPGFSVGAFWNHGWGYWDWGHRRCYVNVNRTVNINRTIIINPREIRTTPWQHDGKHRRGVAYRVPATRERFVTINQQAVDYRRNSTDYEQSRPTGPNSGVARPAPDTRPSRNITRPAPKTRVDATLVERQSPKNRPAPVVSRPAPKTGPSKKIVRLTPKNRPDVTTVERPSLKSRPAPVVSRPAPKAKPGKIIARSAPKTRPVSTVVERPSVKTRPDSTVVERPSAKTRPDSTTVERPTPDTRPGREIARLTPQTSPDSAKRSERGRGKPNPARK
ncbi:MAG: DUF3300 domain-containing protein [Deltaproteobacteria bacterium]|nr:DUF3300 domain-containing protein [Deltaproteobacteria bacterium]MBN2686630.1 DUF3300 domain-containing protein [Deltaproteobacteria bacterium]